MLDIKFVKENPKAVKENIQKKYKELLENKEYLEKIYTEGANRARKLASKTLDEVKERIGIL